MLGEVRSGQTQADRAVDERLRASSSQVQLRNAHAVGSPLERESYQNARKSQGKPDRGAWRRPAWAHTGGRLSAQGRIASTAAPTLSAVRSSKRRPTIWSPIGSPSLAKPQGTEKAGHWLTKLNTLVMSRP